MTDRTVSSATSSKLDGPSYEPGWLIDLKTTSPLRFSTRGTVTWNSLVYIPAVVEVRNVADDSSDGSILFRDSTLAIQTLVRTTTLVGRRVALARFYEGALGFSDPIWFFDGYIGGARESVPPAIELSLTRGALARGKAPNRRISSVTGFNILAPEGKVIRFRASNFRLERARA